MCRLEETDGNGIESCQGNMLKIINNDRKLALAQYLINDMLPDSEISKSATCVGKAFEIWEQKKVKKSAQIIFCDYIHAKRGWQIQWL